VGALQADALDQMLVRNFDLVTLLDPEFTGAFQASALLSEWVRMPARENPWGLSVNHW